MEFKELHSSSATHTQKILFLPTAMMKKLHSISTFRVRGRVHRETVMCCPGLHVLMVGSGRPYQDLIPESMFNKLSLKINSELINTRLATLGFPFQNS